MKMLDVYAILNRRITELVDGVGIIKGSPCTVKSVTNDEVAKTCTVTFEWESKSGVIETEEMVIPYPNYLMDIEKTSTEGLTDNYKMTFSDREDFDYQVENGRGIVDIVKGESVDSLEDEYEVNYNDGTSFRFTVTNGRGVESIVKVRTVDYLTDIYKITYNDGTTQEYRITNAKSIDKIEKISTSEDNITDNYRISFNDTTTQLYSIKNGVGIDSIELLEREVGQDEFVDRYQINFNTPSVDAFVYSITNGFSSSIEVAESTNDRYVLAITQKDEPVIYTPNLKGSNAKFFFGTDLAGTNLEENIDMTVTGAVVNNIYINTETGNMYRCVKEDTWRYECCIMGENGKNAYEVAVNEGYSGTVEDWLESLHAKNIPVQLVWEKPNLKNDATQMDVWYLYKINNEASESVIPIEENAWLSYMFAEDDYYPIGKYSFNAGVSYYNIDTTPMALDARDFTDNERMIFLMDEQHGTLRFCKQTISTLELEDMIPSMQLFRTETVPEGSTVIEQTQYNQCGKWYETIYKGNSREVACDVTVYIGMEVSGFVTYESFNNIVGMLTDMKTDNKDDVISGINSIIDMLRENKDVKLTTANKTIISGINELNEKIKNVNSSLNIDSNNLSKSCILATDDVESSYPIINTTRDEIEIGAVLQDLTLTTELGVKVKKLAESTSRKFIGGAFSSISSSYTKSTDNTVEIPLGLNGTRECIDYSAMVDRDTEIVGVKLIGDNLPDKIINIYIPVEKYKYCKGRVSGFLDNLEQYTKAEVLFADEDTKLLVDENNKTCFAIRTLIVEEVDVITDDMVLDVIKGYANDKIPNEKAVVDYIETNVKVGTILDGSSTKIKDRAIQGEYENSRYPVLETVSTASYISGQHLTTTIMCDEHLLMAYPDKEEGIFLNRLHDTSSCVDVAPDNVVKIKEQSYTNYVMHICRVKTDRDSLITGIKFFSSTNKRNPVIYPVYVKTLSHIDSPIKINGRMTDVYDFDRMMPIFSDPATGFEDVETRLKMDANGVKCFEIDCRVWKEYPIKTKADETWHMSLDTEEEQNKLTTAFAVAEWVEENATTVLDSEAESLSGNSIETSIRIANTESDNLDKYGVPLIGVNKKETIVGNEATTLRLMSSDGFVTVGETSSAVGDSFDMNCLDEFEKTDTTALDNIIDIESLGASSDNVCIISKTSVLCDRDTRLIGIKFWDESEDDGCYGIVSLDIPLYADVPVNVASLSYEVRTISRNGNCPSPILFNKMKPIFKDSNTKLYVDSEGVKTFGAIGTIVNEKKILTDDKLTDTITSTQEVLIPTSEAVRQFGYTIQDDVIDEIKGKSFSISDLAISSQGFNPDDLSYNIATMVDKLPEYGILRDTIASTIHGDLFASICDTLGLPSDELPIIIELSTSKKDSSGLTAAISIHTEDKDYDLILDESGNVQSRGAILHTEDISDIREGKMVTFADLGLEDTDFSIDALKDNIEKVIAVAGQSRHVLQRVYIGEFSNFNKSIIDYFGVSGNGNFTIEIMSSVDTSASNPVRIYENNNTNTHILSLDDGLRYGGKMATQSATPITQSMMASDWIIFGDGVQKCFVTGDIISVHACVKLNDDGQPYGLLDIITGLPPVSQRFNFLSMTSVGTREFMYHETGKIVYSNVAESVIPPYTIVYINMFGAIR